MQDQNPLTMDKNALSQCHADSSGERCPGREHPATPMANPRSLQNTKTGKSFLLWASEEQNCLLLLL